MLHLYNKKKNVIIRRVGAKHYSTSESEPSLLSLYRTAIKTITLCSLNHVQQKETKQEEQKAQPLRKNIKFRW